VLKLVASTLKSAIREADLIGRWGGEEFIILLPNTSLDEAFHLIERLRSLVSESVFEVNGEKVQLSISAGLSSTRYYSSWDDLLKSADKHLYRAKSSGRNCICTTEH
jgi:diguanylate cyclase (GGDEF)-like protein